MFKLSRSYFLSVMLTALMTTCICAQELPTDPVIVEWPGVGDPFPHFQLTDTAYQPVQLYDYLPNEPVVLIYYRGGW